jgi:xylulose-5-phosphate/fructose-6-phosphate phosphoketolase
MSAAASGPLSDADLEALDAYWRAANYLTVGQIYLRDNALLTEPLRPEHIKPRLLGHWGTSPGLSLVWTHLDRVIRARDADVVSITGPGHGGPAILANVWLEGTYSEVYPDITRDADGMRRFFRQFSTPGGVPSHVSVPTPGSIHEGGELGYSLMHAVGAAFDNPELVVACVIGDGEAETGPLSGSWQGIDFLNPARDGAVLPILHLNGYKISGPTVFGRATNAAVESILKGYGWDPIVVEGDDPPVVHRALADALDRSFDRIHELQAHARAHGVTRRPRWPAIVLRTPKGWTGPKVVDGVQVEGTFRAHQVPLANVRDNPEHLAMLEEWMRSYRPEELFDEHGRPVEAVVAQAPTGDRRMGANPHANGGVVLRDLDLPDFADYALPVPSPGAELHESTHQLGLFLRDTFTRNADAANFRLFCPDETNSNRLGSVFDVENRCLLEPALPTDDHVAPDGRVMEILSEHNCQGWLEGYLLTGRHGLFATYEAFAMVSASMTVQHTKWLEAASDLTWRAPIASLNVLLTSTCWRNDHNGFSHQGPGLIDTIITKRGNVARMYFPPDANCLLSVADHCFRNRDCVNLIVIDKQPEPQWLTMEQAAVHCAAGASIWEWAGSQRPGAEPDIVLASAGDVPTMELLAAADLLRKFVPELEYRVVNVVDLMTLFLPERHPHGMDGGAFLDLFTSEADVVFAFHGYASAMHHVIHGRPHPARFHVRGYQEEGTTTTPFDMVVRNEMSRYHLALEAMRRARRKPVGAESLVTHCNAKLKEHRGYVVQHLEDMPEVTGWRWGQA